MNDRSPLNLNDNGHDISSANQSLTSDQSRADLIPQARSSRISNNPMTDEGHNFGQSVGNHAEHRQRSSSQSSSDSKHLKYGAKNVIEIFVPVSICMAIVVGTMKATNSYNYSSQSVVWYAQLMFTDQSVDTGTRVWQSFANALIMLGCIVVMTTVLIIFYKFRCYATIHGWLILGSLTLLFMFALMYVAELLKVYNIPMDGITVTIFIWNFGVVGMICIHWKGPLLMQQAYLILVSALMSLLLIKCLPDWTIWTVLAIVSVWDLIAVLCPCGPLRILVETAQERNEPIFPALIYSSAMMWETISMAETDADAQAGRKRRRNKRNKTTHRESEQTSGGESSTGIQKVIQHHIEIEYDAEPSTPRVEILSSERTTAAEFLRSSPPDNVTSSTQRRTIHQSHRAGDEYNIRDASSRARSASQPMRGASSQLNQSGGDSRVVEYEERGVKLGLGDFIFFSVLVGKASTFDDWTITMSCYVAILLGLCLTLSLLAVMRKALPALPISIAFGLIAFFLSYMFVAPFAGELATNQVFV